jgi:hypothetical protein
MKSVEWPTSNRKDSEFSSLLALFGALAGLAALPGMAPAAAHIPGQYSRLVDGGHKKTRWLVKPKTSTIKT